jgi:hypothetical protein
MAFNRYDILTNYYTQEIKNWNWQKILDGLTEYVPEGHNPEHDDPLVGVWIGTTRGVLPSGKIYTFWTSNQKRSDVIKDECFSDALEQVAAEHGLFLDYVEDSVFLVKSAI